MTSDRAPVIAAVGESTDRSAQVLHSKSPMDLVLQAVQATRDDANAALIERIDRIDVIKQVSNPYPQFPGELREHLNLSACYAEYGDGSGNGPLREIQNAALQIQAGQIEVALVCGSEAQWSIDRARKQGLHLPWLRVDADQPMFPSRHYTHPMAVKYGLITPTQVYPLYENAVSAQLGQTPLQARAEIADIGSRMSMVASQSPMGWTRRSLPPQQIANPDQSNRPIAWPYLKYMVANPSVNLGSAIILTSLGLARRLGIAPERLVHIHHGAAAREGDDYLRRDRYDRCAAQSAVLLAAQERSRRLGYQIDFFELYSCFPVVPRMARRILEIDPLDPLTVAGGLSFFGGPVHNYMSHAVIAAVRRLRAGNGRYGLLYGQGGHVTQHHALLLSSQAPAQALDEHYSVQESADRIRGKIPEVVDRYTGPASIETFTVIYQRDGTPDYGVVLAALPDGRRTLARVPGESADMLNRLTNLDHSPVGERGWVVSGVDEFNIWAD